MASTAELLIQIRANAGEAIAEMRETSSAVKQLETTTTAGGASAQHAGGLFNKFGGELKQIGKIAAGMATGMLAANLTMGIAERVKDAAEQIDTYGRSVLQVQRLTGESAESSSMLVAMFTRFAPSVDVATTRLARFEKTLAGQEDALEVMANGGKTAASYLQEFGVRTNDASGHLRPTTDILLDLAEGFHTSGDAAAKNGALVALFGRGSQDMLLMLNQGRGGLKSFMADMQKYGLVLNQDNLNDVAAFIAAHKNMDLALQGVALQFGASFMPAITAAAQSTTRFAQFINQALMPAIHAIPGALPAIVSAIGLVAAAFSARLAVAAAGATAATVRWAVVSSAQAVAAAVRVGLAVAGVAGAFLYEAAAATFAAGATLAAWVAAAAPIELIVGVIVTAFGAVALAASGKLGEAKDAIGEGFNQLGTTLHNASELLQNGFKLDGFDAGKAFASGISEGADAGGEEVVSAGVKSATRLKEAADEHLKQLQLDQEDRKVAFEVGHLGAEQELLQLKLDQASAENALIDQKRQLEDLDRAAIDYSHQRLQLDEQDAITRAKIAESALKTKDEDLSYQEKLLKAQLVASRHGGPAVDRTAMHRELRDLHNQQLRDAPALLIAEHNTALAERARSGDDLTYGLVTSSTSRSKLAIDEAMAPGEADALAKKRAAEDATHALDEQKARNQISDGAYTEQLLLAQAAAKQADADLYKAQHPGSVSINGPITINVHGGATNAETGQSIKDAIGAWFKNAVDQISDTGAPLKPALAGARY